MNIKSVKSVGGKRTRGCVEINTIQWSLEETRVLIRTWLYEWVMRYGATRHQCAARVAAKLNALYPASVSDGDSIHSARTASQVTSKLIYENMWPNSSGSHSTTK